MGGAGADGKIRVWGVEKAADTVLQARRGMIIHVFEIPLYSNVPTRHWRICAPWSAPALVVLWCFVLNPHLRSPCSKLPTLYSEISYLSHPILPVLAGRVCASVRESV